MSQASSGTVARPRPAGALVRAAHPGPTVAVTLFATAYAVSVGLPLARVGLVAGAVLAGQLSIGWGNDLVDLRRDRAVGRSDKPLATGELSVASTRAACIGAAAATVVLSLACGLLAGVVHLIAVAAGWAYDLGLKATVLSWLPYAVAFGALPAFVTLAGRSVALPPGWVLAATALLGVGAHLVNVVPDLVDDEATGVRGVGHRLGSGAATVTAVVVLSAATGVTALGVAVQGATGVSTVLLAAAVAVVAALVVVALLARGRTPFRAAIGIAAVDVLLLVVTG